MYAHPGHVTDACGWKGDWKDRKEREEGGGRREEINVGRLASRPGGSKGHCWEPCFCLIAKDCEESWPWL